MNNLIQKVQEAINAENEELYSVVSVRTPAEIGAMVETISIISDTPVMNLFSQKLSEYLADYLLEDVKNIDIIDKVVKEDYQTQDIDIGDIAESSCIGILQQKKVLLEQIYLVFLQQETFRIMFTDKLLPPQVLVVWLLLMQKDICLN